MTFICRRSAISDPWPNPTQPAGQANARTTLWQSAIVRNRIFRRAVCDSRK